jgi:hypothetical protein
LSADNYEEAARIGLQAASFPLDAGALDGLLGPTASALSAEPKRRIAAALSSVRPQAVTNNDVPCPQGGRISTQFNDVNNNRSLDAGDNITISYVDCRFPDGVLRGKTIVTIDTYSMTGGLSNATMRVELQDFAVTAPNGDRAGGNGVFQISFRETPGGLYTFGVEAAQVNKSSVIAGRSSQHVVSNLRSLDTTSSIGGAVVSTTTASASLRSSAWSDKSLQLSTDPNWTRREMDQYPSGGRLLIRGANGSQVSVVALNAQQVRIELDADGDGLFESKVTRNWRDLGV